MSLVTESLEAQSENIPGLQLTNLSDDLLASILFSNYLSPRWSDVMSIVLVCRLFLSLGVKHIAFIDYTCTKRRGLSPLRLFSPTLRLCFLDLSYEALYRLEIFMGPLKKLTSIRGLKLRGADMEDCDLRFLSKLVHLRYLDLSTVRPQDSYRITDDVMKPVCSLSSIRWIDLSLTNITDESIRVLCASNPHLYHLAVQCCALLTDEASQYFQELKIKTLDISGCNKFTITTFETLVNPLNAISNSLSRLSMNYLRNVRTKDAITLLLRLKSLSELECRNVFANSKPPEGSIFQIPKALRAEAYGRFATCILKHSDLLTLRGKSCMINPTPDMVQLCPTFAFPYKSENEL